MPFEERQVDDLGGGVGGEVEDEQLRLRPRRAHGLTEQPEEIAARQERDRAQLAARDDHRVLMDGIGRAGAEDHVARAEHRERQVSDALLRADRDDRLARRDRSRRRSGAGTSRRSRPAACRCRATPSSDGSAASAQTRPGSARCAAASARRGCPCDRSMMSSPARRAAVLELADDVEDVGRETLDTRELHGLTTGPLIGDHAATVKSAPSPRAASDASSQIVGIGILHVPRGRARHVLAVMARDDAAAPCRCRPRCRRR